MMHQALHRDLCIKAWCKMCNHDTQRFDEANNTLNDGLGIDTREGISAHFGAPLFERGNYTLHELDRLSQRHPTDSMLSQLIPKLRSRRSAREADGCSLTITETSLPVACRRPGAWRRGSSVR